MEHDSPKERRKYTRVQYVSNVQLYSGTSYWGAKIQDISLKGVLLTKPDGWSGQKNDVFRLNIQMDGSAGISMSIQVAHVDEVSIGAKWTQIDMDSFSRLKRILELHFADSDMLSREISHLTNG